ncbi:hypothetical protein [Streptomyces shenzhenensis]|uniref:hypothetical protein n=1 Tax=Streptomyces shenzhenensis TaxID=943815 RepID=UPI0015F0300B|nr:hypothetical protein [Streptomyces shenzhenensis]
MAVSGAVRNNRSLVFGAVGVVLAAVVAAVAAYGWHEHNKPSQASAADCRLAQRIVDEAQRLPKDAKAADAWGRRTATMRRAQMKDGYLGAQISNYEGWAVLHAKGEGEPPAGKELARIAKEANSHCTDAGITLTLPAFGS